MNDKPKGESAKSATGATMADVAALARVSRAVVSRAFSVDPRPISPEKRERVLKAAAQLGYQPNLLAQSLTTKRTNLVAVVVNHIHDLSDLDLFDSLLNAMQALGKQVLFIRVNSVDRVEQFLRNGVAHHVDAALVWSDFADAATVRQMFRSDFAVMLNGRPDPLSPAVVPDSTIGIRAAVRDATEKGVRTAALVTGRESSPVEQARIQIYLHALSEHGVTLVQTVRAGDYTYQSGYQAGASFLSDKVPDAVFCTSDASAMGVLDACRAHFPESRPTRFRLYGYDNLSLTDFAAYPISSVGYDQEEFVGHIARFVAEPNSFTPGDPPVAVPTRFIPRLTG